jgi:hypothetical protein
MTNKLTKGKRDALYAAVGRLVLKWAEAEMYLDLLALKLRDPSDKPDYQLSNKIKLIRKALRCKTIPQSGNIMKLLDEIERLAPMRHDYAHGAMLNFTLQNSALSVTLGRLLQPRFKPRRPTIRVTAAEIEKISDQIDAVADQMLNELESMVAKRPLH